MSTFYPIWMYHPTKPPVLVQNDAAYQVLVTSDSKWSSVNSTSTGSINLGPVSGTGFQNALQAFQGGGQTNATQLIYGVNQVTIVASAGDSVSLPPGNPSQFPVIVTNADTPNAMNVFPQSGDAINTLGANAAYSVASGKTVIFYCSADSQWYSVLTA